MGNEIRIATIVIWDGKAYLPSQARYVNDGPFTNIDPVYTVNPELHELLDVLRQLLSKKPSILPYPTQDEVKERRDLMLKATGARNWKQLSKNGIAYTIEQSPKGFLIEMSRVDSRGRWEFDPAKQVAYQTGTDLSVVIKTILNDLNNR